MGVKIRTLLAVYRTPNQAPEWVIRRGRGDQAGPRDAVVASGSSYLLALQQVADQLQGLDRRTRRPDEPADIFEVWS